MLPQHEAMLMILQGEAEELARMYANARHEPRAEFVARDFMALAKRAASYRAESAQAPSRRFLDACAASAADCPW